MDKVILGAVYLSKALLYGLLIYAVFLVIMRVANGRKREVAKSRYAVEYAFIVYIITLIQITGITDFASWHFLSSVSFNIEPFVNGDLSMAALNVLLFVPMGLLMPLVLRIDWNWCKAGLFGAGSSLLIELFQLLLIGRTADINDILANTAGCVMGYLIFFMAGKVYRSIQGDKSVGLGTAAGVIALIVFLFCVPIRRICLADIMLMQFSIPVWSGSTQSIYAMEGIHYTLIIVLVLEGLMAVITKKRIGDFGAETGFIISIAASALLITMLCIGY